MVLPIILWGAVALGTAVVGGGAYMAYNKWWSGKSIVVLGGRGVGKTTLLNYLRTKRVSTSCESTDVSQKYPSMNIEIDGLSLKIKAGADVGGSSINHRAWREQVKEADILFYIIDISQVIGAGRNEQYIANTKSDLEAIADTVNERAKKVSERTEKKMPIFILASHTDKCDEFYSNRPRFEDKVIRSQIVGIAEMLFGGTDYCKVILGSLKDEIHAEKFMKNVLNSIEQ